MSVELPKKCFVMMPISDPEGYAPGHFERVYRHLIQPACELAGLVPLRADETNKTNYIVADVVQQILSCDMAVCDISSRNPNVMYELGIRHAFSKPVTLVRDSRTARVFDIQGLRDLEYDVNLRVDNIKETIAILAERLLNTLGSGSNDVNSPVQFLNLAPAKIPPVAEVSQETALVLGAISGLGDRVAALEQQPGAFGARRPNPDHTPSASLGDLPKKYERSEGKVAKGDMAWHSKFGLGTVVDRKGDNVTVRFPGAGQRLLVAAYLTRVVLVPDSLDDEVDNDETQPSVGA